MKSNWIISTITFALVAASASAAENSATNGAPPKPGVKSLAVFKNGLGFVMKSGVLPLSNGWARLEPLPAAALGSLWIGSTDKAAPVTDVIAGKEHVKEKAEAISLAELLEANIGKEAVITYQVGTSVSTVEGTILSVPESRKVDPDDFAGPVAASRIYSSLAPSEIAGPGQVVAIRVSRGGGNPRIVIVNKSLIQAIEFVDKPEFQTMIEKDRLVTKLHLRSDKSSAEIALMYLEKGLMWSPSYRLDIHRDKVATLALDAALANDAEDLQDAEVSFVVGFPHFLYADNLTPLSVRQSVAAFIESLGRAPTSDRNNRFGNNFANTMSQSIAYNDANFDRSIPAEAAYSATLTMPGESNQDLFSYRQARVTLKKGDRASFTVFDVEAPYEHLYEWVVPDSMNVDDSGRRRAGSQEAEEQVWHVLRLENKTKQPWTTAPAFALDENVPLAQDVLKYTPPGAKNTLRLTVAVGVRAEQSQIESGRRQITLSGYPYDEVSVDGTLKLSNHKQEEIRMTVRKSVVGEVLSAKENGKITRVARAITAVNPNTEIEWEFALAPGATRELGYQYKALIRR